MDDFSVFASRFGVNSKSLEMFDEALRFFKEKEEIIRTPEVKEMIDKLLVVITPVIENIQGNLSESTVINDRDVIAIIRERHHKEWPTYKVKLEQLHVKLNSSRFILSENDFNLLNDIADALDAECALLFRKMRER